MPRQEELPFAARARKGQSIKAVGPGPWGPHEKMNQTQGSEEILRAPKCVDGYVAGVVAGPPGGDGRWLMGQARGLQLAVAELEATHNYALIMS